MVTVAPGARFARQGPEHYILAPDNRADYDALISELAASARMPQRIAHLWSVGDADQLARAGFDDSQALGFYSLLYLAQALGAEDAYAGVHVGVISNYLQAVADTRVIHPERATLLGAADHGSRLRERGCI